MDGLDIARRNSGHTNLCILGFNLLPSEALSVELVIDGNRLQMLDAERMRIA